MRKKKFLVFLLVSFIIFIYFFLNSTIDKTDKYKSLKSLLTSKQKEIIKKYIFPYKTIYLQEQKIISQNRLISDLSFLKILKPYLVDAELAVKNNLSDIEIARSDIKLSNNKYLKKYKLENGFYSGIHKPYPGSGYIDFHENVFFVLSSRGILAFTKELNDNTVLKQINNNISDFIGIKQFRKWNRYSLKDLFIYKDKIFVSYTEEIKNDCWNTSVIFANIDYENIKFEKLFSSPECIQSYRNVDKEFNADEEFEPHQSGGRMIKFQDSSILLSIGEYKNRYLAQDKNSVNGKIIKIDFLTEDYKIISMGHRNPQGLYFDKENNFILEAEHGPIGGDEINIIEIEKINDKNILNYGWAIVSDGEFPGDKQNEKNKKRYKKYPLYKSHSKHGFIEPIKSFTPSIGISEIVKVAKNRYVVSSMKDKSLYFFDLNQDNKILNLERVEVFERVRDLRFKNNKLYLFLENSVSIGIIDLN